MSPERREMDKILRSLSEVGYVALVKRLLGFKLKDPEAGLENRLPLLGQPSAFIHAENQRREMEQRIVVDSDGYGLNPTLTKYPYSQSGSGYSTGADKGLAGFQGRETL